MIGTDDPATSWSKTSAASTVFAVTRTISQPAMIMSRICQSVASTSAVSVFVIDCTGIGAPPPMSTFPRRICRVFFRGARVRLPGGVAAAGGAFTTGSCDIVAMLAPRRREGSERPPVRRDVLRDVVVEDDGDEREDHQEPDLEDPLLHLQREVAPRDPFQPDQEEVPAVQHRDRHEVEDAELERDRGHQSDERDGAGARRLAGELRNVERAGHRTHARLPSEEPSQDLQRHLEIRLDAPPPFDERLTDGEPLDDLRQVRDHLHADLPGAVRVLAGSHARRAADAAPLVLDGERPRRPARHRAHEGREHLFRSASDLLARDGQDHVARLQARGLRRRAGDDHRDARPHGAAEVRQQPDVAEVVFRARLRDDVELGPRPAPIDLDAKLLARVHPEDELDVAPARRLLPVHRDDAVARSEARGRAGGFRLDDLDDRRLELVRGNADADREHRRVEEDREEEVHEGAGEQDERSLPALPDRGGRLRRAFRHRGLVGAEPDDPHVSAERDRRDAVVGSLPLLSEEPLSEPDREDLDGKAERLCEDEVAELVEDDEDREHQEEREGISDDRHNREPSAFQLARARVLTIRDAVRRPARSSSSASSTLPGAGVRPCAEAVSDTTATMSGNEIFPSRNASTPISLAALTIPGIPPPASRAARAIARAG